MLLLAHEEIERRRAADPHGRMSTAEIEREVAREQFVAAIKGLAGNTIRDPHLEIVIDALTFAIDYGVI